IIAVWATLTRPHGEPEVTYPAAFPVVREGETLRWHAEVAPPQGLQQTALMFERSPYLTLDPTSGVVQSSVRTGEGGTALGVALRSTRWGTRPAGRALVAATSSWAGFQWGPVELDPAPLTTLPLPAVFDAGAPAPHPVGLVGLNRSARPGDGSEFASIRPFQHGDRLRRIHWPVSLRAGELHVSSTWADQDTQVMLVVDALNDLGESAGIDGVASSLDVTVRAAGAMAEHFLRHGDRVGLRVLGPSAHLRVSPAAGQNHLRRVLHRLAAVTPGTRVPGVAETLQLGIGAGTMVVLLSACISSVTLQQAVVLARRGLTVIVVDTLPAGMAGQDEPWAALAWRIRRLERAMEMRQVTQAGVPIVQWAGPGSLDQVLRDLARRSGAPRMARR
ncbi:MAG: DUF58 domain-containing protein, partial [Nocardioidaceae bacterium]